MSKDGKENYQKYLAEKQKLSENPTAEMLQKCAALWFKSDPPKSEKGSNEKGS